MDTKLIIAAIAVVLLIVIYLMYYSSSSGAFIGNYADSAAPGGRDFEKIISPPGSLWTWSQCHEAAKKSGYKYFAIQGGGECHVGNSFGKYGPSTSKVAYDNSGHAMGGPYVNSVYMV